MVAAQTSTFETPKGWLAAFLGANRAEAPRRRAERTRQPVECVVAPEVSAAILAVDFIEDRVRAATSGFEMGEYEPFARRN